MFLRPREVKRLSKATHGRDMRSDQEFRQDNLLQSPLPRDLPIQKFLFVLKREEREFWNCLPDLTHRVIRTMN